MTCLVAACGLLRSSANDGGAHDLRTMETIRGAVRADPDTDRKRAVRAVAAAAAALSMLSTEAEAGHVMTSRREIRNQIQTGTM